MRPGKKRKCVARTGSRMARRSLPATLQWLMALWLVACACAGPAHAAPRLRVLAWPGYADADVVAQFEKRHAVRVEVTIVSSDEALRQQMASAQPAFDVVAANTVEVARLVGAKKLAPLNLQAIPNLAHQLPRFHPLSAIAGISVAQRVYAAPYTWSEMGLIYDRTQFAVPPDSWAELWDPKWRGRVLEFDSADHGFSLAALHRGLPPFHISREQMGSLALDLVAFRRNLLAFYNLPEQAVRLFRAHEAALLFANYGKQQLKLLRDAGLDVGYVIPREGALAWLDCWAVPSGARQPVLAHQWIDYMLEPSVSHTLTLRQGLANTLEPTLGLEVGAPEPKILWLEPLEDESQRSQLWRRIVSGERPERF
ncbi:MAG: ABC transporter substrate-binding protein [Giesbergeria sp.]